MVKRRKNQPDKVKGEEGKKKLEVEMGREELVNPVEVEGVERETELVEDKEEVKREEKEETKQVEEGKGEKKLEKVEDKIEKDKEGRTELRIKWEVGVLEVKALYYYKKLPLRSLFAPEELRDHGEEPSKRELTAKLETLRGELTKVKVEQLVKLTQKEVKDAIKLESLRLVKKSKRLNSNNKEEGEKENPNPEHDWKKELELTKAIDCHQFARSLLGVVLKRNRLLANHPHLTSYLPGPPFSDAFPLTPSPSDSLVTKLVQRLFTTKIIANCSHRIKADLFTHLKLEVTPTPKPSDPIPSEPTTEPDSIATVTTKPTKPQAKSKSKPTGSTKPVSDSLFVTSLGDFDEEDGEFKKIYGIKGKNRPGQRQRRKMTEEKYGAEARHHPPPSSAAHPSKSKSKPKFPSDTTTPARPPPAKRSATPLHPSWEAKRHQQQRISLAHPPKNQKIVFD